MWVHSLICSLFFAFAFHFCYGHDKKIEVFGIVECADCKGSNIKSSHVFSGLHVTIDCMLKNGVVIRRGAGKVGVNGKFKALLPEGILHEGKLKGKCYAQLQSGSAACPAYNGIEDSRIVVFKSETDDGKYRLKTKGILKFSSVFCTSDFLWPFLDPISAWKWKKKFLLWKYFGQPWFLPPFLQTPPPPSVSQPPVIPPAMPPVSLVPQPSPPPMMPLLPWWPINKPPWFPFSTPPVYQSPPSPVPTNNDPPSS